MDDWLGKPALLMALEAGMRHMSRSEETSSPLRSQALGLILVHSKFYSHTLFFLTFWAEADPSTIHLYMSLVKSVRLELAEGTSSSSEGRVRHNSISSVVSAQLMLEMLAWLGHSLVQRALVLGNVGVVSKWMKTDCGSISSGSSFTRSIEHSQSFTKWLRPQLILLRSWVLFWVELSDKNKSTAAFETATAKYMELAALFRQESFKAVAPSMMNPMLKACGFDHIYARRQGRSTPGSHARWERFANLHLDGIPLPGCSNWGCTNLAGFSESALPTLLCSRCRRVRYCSIECQKAAWVQGEHKSVCVG